MLHGVAAEPEPYLITKEVLSVGLAVKPQQIPFSVISAPPVLTMFMVPDALVLVTLVAVEVRTSARTISFSHEEIIKMLKSSIKEKNRLLVTKK